MIMLYDTLLPDGTYRLGVRLARPADLVRFPPFEGDAAREIVRTRYISSDGVVDIPLELEPLTEVGTRIIVPFLSDEASAAFRDGEMVAWLERCWWRAIQIGRLEIQVTVAGATRTIGVPPWWESEPWRQDLSRPNVLVRENVRIDADTDRQIKRIVVLHDPTLQDDDIADVAGAQYAGVQLLRGQQWIETLGTREEFTDFVPADARPGFRGFVEFDRELEAELREVESPQHDAFHRRRPFVRQIGLVIREAVKDFAGAQGWLSEEDHEPHEDRTADDVLREITELFISGSATDGPGDADTWTCTLDLDYPNADTTRVEWNDWLTGISAFCTHSTPDERRDVHVVLAIIDPMGERRVLASKDLRTSQGSAVADLDDLRIVKVGTEASDVECPMLGRYRLRAECFCGDARVATSSRNIHVRMDPPEPPPAHPVSVEIKVRNVDADRVRVNDGERVDIAVLVKNRGIEGQRLKVVASLGDLLFLDDTGVELRGRVVGDQPVVSTMVKRVRISTTGATDPVSLSVVLEPGRHPIRVDVFDDTGEVVASAARNVWVEEDPDDGGPDLPFIMRPRDGSTIPYPVWELVAPHQSEPDWTLFYATSHPLHQAALYADAAGTPGFAGRRMYFAEMTCAALIEWALSRYREDGDEEGFQLLQARAGDTAGPLWERYSTCLEQLVERAADTLEAIRLQREAVSLMLYVLRAQAV
jgi:hypothetical protein